MCAKKLSWHVSHLPTLFDTLPGAHGVAVCAVHSLPTGHTRRCSNAAVAALGIALLGKSGLAIPHGDIFNSGVSQMLAMAASNEALRYVSYPTQVLGKSCKMVPVMLMGYVVSRRVHSCFEYAVAIGVTAGA